MLKNTESELSDVDLHKDYNFNIAITYSIVFRVVEMLPKRVEDELLVSLIKHLKSTGLQFARKKSTTYILKHTHIIII